jgi:signal transduction histidine kinase
MQRTVRLTDAATRRTASVGLLVLATYASIVIAVPSARTWDEAAAAAIQLLLPAALASSVLLCVACRLYPRAGVAWFAAATTMVGVQGFPSLVAPSGSSGLAEPVMLWSAAALGVAMLILIRFAAASRVEVTPISIGIGLGLALILFRGVGELLPGSLVVSTRTTAFGCAALVAVSAALALTVWQHSALPRTSRRLLAVAVVLWSVSLSLHGLTLTHQAGWSVVAISGALATCALLMSTSLELLWQALRDDREAVLQLQQQMTTLRARAKEGVEQLHEVKGTIAGIASATDLIRHEDRLSPKHREHLAEMLAHETARLQRLVHAGPRQSMEAVDLDEILQPLLTAREVQGQRVVWEAGGLQVVADADELTEVLNILLHNAAEHAPGSPVHVFTRRRDDRLELVVADCGPGVPPELRDRIFEWGYSRPGSTGQGVGLAMAHQLLAARGISLELDAEHTPGAAFVIQLRPADRPSAQREAALLVR